MPKTRYLCKSFCSDTLGVSELAQRQFEPSGSVDLKQAHRDDLKDAAGRWHDVVAHLEADVTTIQSDHATETRTVTCFLCKGAGEVCAGTAGGFFDSHQEQWFPDEQSYICPCCKGNGEVDETFCLICAENVHACSCTHEKIDTYLLASYLGAA